MKKVLALLVVSVMALSAASCAPATSNSGTADNAAAAATSEAAPQLAPYVIDYYMLANSVSSDAGPISEEINKIIQPKFNATLNITMLTWGDWFTKTQAALAAGEKVDLLFTADWYQYMTSIANNNLMPLNDLLAKYAPDTVAQLGETFIKGSQFNNINYAVPTDKELAVNGGFCWNKTLADKYGLKVDPTWKSVKDWEPLLKTIKENEPNVIPYLTDGNLYHLNYISYVGCDLAWDGNKPTDPTLQWIYDYPEYLNEIRVMQDFYNKGYIPKDSTSAATNDWMSKHLIQGDFFMSTQPLKPGKGKSGELMAAMSDHSIQLDEYETYPLLVNTTHCGGSMLAIPNTSKDPARAMMFINEMHTNPDVTNLLAWGIEGKDYTVVQADNPKRVKPVDGNTWTPAVLVWTLGNVYNVWLSDVEPEDKYPLLAQTKKGIPQHIANGYRFNVEKYQDQMTAIATVTDQYNTPIRVGAMDLDKTLPEYKAAMDAAGFQTFKDAAVQDFQAWLATQKK